MEALSDVRAAGAPRSVSGHTDADVIARSRREPERFAEIFDRHYPAIHGFLARRLGSSLADDLTSETFLIAFDRRRRYDRRYESARPWLFGIAATLVGRQRRAELRRYRALARLDAGHAHDPDQDEVAGRLDAAALRGRLAAALAELAHRDREVLLLVAWGHLSCEETARALGIRAGTARSRLHRARQRTRSALTGEERDG
jgi:RNA polymerase sigma-70 factor (ECF subfamily)